MTTESPSLEVTSVSMKARAVLRHTNALPAIPIKVSWSGCRDRRLSLSLQSLVRRRKRARLPAALQACPRTLPRRALRVPKVQIKFARNPSLCATVQGTPSNGALVNFANCLNPTSPSAANQLFYAFNNGPIQLAGTNYCFDAGRSIYSWRTQKSPEFSARASFKAF